MGNCPRTHCRMPSPSTWNGFLFLGSALWGVLAASGCASKETHQQLLEDLEKVRQDTAQLAAEDEKRLTDARPVWSVIWSIMPGSLLSGSRLSAMRTRDRWRITIRKKAAREIAESRLPYTPRI